MSRLTFSRREAGRRLIACWARLLGNECRHPSQLRQPTLLKYADKCMGCHVLVSREHPRQLGLAEVA